MTDTEFQAMRQAVIDGDADAAEAAAHAAIAAGIPPLQAIDEGFMPGMKEVGAGFACGDLYLPDMMLAARAMQRALTVLEPELKASATERTVAGRVVIGTVAGDIHEIGKNLVGMLLSTSGFEVHDLGVNVSPERFVAAARERGVLVYSGTGAANGVDGDTVLLGPPFVTTDEELVRIADGVAGAIEAATAG